MPEAAPASTAKPATPAAPATPAPAAPAAPAIVSDPRKAQEWFRKSVEAEKTQNYDYALTALIMGLQFDADNLEQHKKALQIGRIRKSKGGKPGGGLFGGEKFSVNGKGPLVPVLNALESLARDPENVSKWERLVAAASAVPDIPRAAEWYGDELFAQVRAEKDSRSKAEKLRMLKNHFKAFEVFNKARLCAQLGRQILPEDIEFNDEDKNLAAQHVTQKGKYDTAGQEGTDFKASVKDFDKQIEAMRVAADVKSDDFILSQIKVNREKYKKDSKNPVVMREFVRALLRKEADETENEAIAVLEQGYKDTLEYNLKIQAGDIRMKQNSRKLREMKAQIAAANLPPDKLAVAEQRYVSAQRGVWEAEIKEYQERAAKYPTDRDIRFEIGRRCMDVGRVDDAIDSLQAAESAPKLRVRVCNLLGAAFMQKEWYDEAVESFKRAIENYEGTESDERNLELHYNLGNALEKNGQLEDALKEFSSVARLKLTFKDVRDRVQRLRKRPAGATSGTSPALAPGGADPMLPRNG